ncbi:MAG: transcriptional regulator [Candidatus Riflebacteria bacterium]|nr:transcriptional regulator [Candidatus Riflebacteria bacterium]
MLNPIKLIQNENEYSEVLKKIETLWDKAIPGTPDGEEFELLSLILENYEKRSFSVDANYDPIDVIKFWMEQKNLTRKDLEPLVGHRGRVAEILNRKRPLSIEMIRKFAKAGIPAQMLIGEINIKKNKNQTVFPKRLNTGK